MPRAVMEVAWRGQGDRAQAGCVINPFTALPLSFPSQHVFNDSSTPPNI